jgi:hypothetical protein
VKRAVFHPEASQEYLAAIEYHAALSAELGERSRASFSPSKVNLRKKTRAFS